MIRGFSFSLDGIHAARPRQSITPLLQRAASVGFVGALEGVIPEVSAGGAHAEEEDEGGQVPGAAGGQGEQQGKYERTHPAI